MNTPEWIDVVVLESDSDKVIELVYKNRIYKYDRDIKFIRPHLVKWLKTKNIGYVFSLDMFFTAYPKQRTYHKDNMRYLSILVEERRIIQISNTSFKLIAH